MKRHDSLCLVVTCDALPTDPHGFYMSETCIKQRSFYNDSCELECELGYNLTSSDGVHKCTENGTWSNNVTCERK